MYVTYMYILYGNIKNPKQQFTPWYMHKITENMCTHKNAGCMFTAPFSSLPRTNNLNVN